MKRKPKKQLKFLSTILLLAIAVSSFAGKYKEINFSTPKYLPRKSEPWKKMTRVVGELKYAPESFTIEIFSHSVGKVIKTETFTNKISVYETDWLPPGTYTLEFKAEGYDKSFVKSLKLEAESDCFINVEFGKIEYNRNY